ncbi:MAG: sigma-70 family RNA polymerase sigma factor [Clostridia bacterium]
MLTNEERKLVEENMKIAEYIVNKDIIKSNKVLDLSYEDLYQTAYLALCKAAKTYNGKFKFSTYASTVVKNALIDYCRKIPTASQSLNETIFEDDTPLIDTIISDAHTEEIVIESELLNVLNNSKKMYNGVVLKGIEAMELKLKGYSGTEIGAMYGVKNTHISAWISKAAKKLRDNSEFKALMLG